VVRGAVMGGDRGIAAVFDTDRITTEPDPYTRLTPTPVYRFCVPVRAGKRHI